MTLQLLENFESIALTYPKYQYLANVIIDGTGYDGSTGCLKNSATSSYYWHLPVPVPTTELYTGFHHYESSSNSNTYSRWQFCSELGPEAFIGINSDNGFTIWGTGGSVLVTSATGLVPIATWVHIEIKCKPSASMADGDILIKLDGVEVLRTTVGQSALFSGSSVLSEIRFRGSYTGYYKMDNLYISDGSGSTNNTLLGMVRVKSLVPNGNGNSNQFVGNDADSVDNYLHVDETITDGDTSYVDSTGANDIDLYAYADISEGQSIVGISIDSSVKKSLPGDNTFNHVVRVGGVNYDQEVKYPAAGSFGYFSTVVELNPDDSGAWVAADINGAEFGIKAIA